MSEYSGSIDDENINGEEDPLYKKGVKAAERYLIHRGYDVYDVNPDDKIQIIAYDSDSDEVHLVHVWMMMERCQIELKCNMPTLVELRKRMISFVKANESFKDCDFHCDRIAIVVINDSKAKLSHFDNYFGEFRSVR